LLSKGFKLLYQLLFTEEKLTQLPYLTVQDQGVAHLILSELIPLLLELVIAKTRLGKPPSRYGFLI
jgi:hypothetical protein